MSIQTRSAFYYGHTITRLNNAIDFKEGGSELQATLNNGDYTLEDFLAEIQRAMNAVGALTYTVSVDRSTRFITIAATGTFSLLAGTGSRIGTGTWTLMGFAATDLTGAATYTGTFGSGSQFLPQSIFFGYVPSGYSQEKNAAVVNESASGLIQVIQFGTNSYLEFNIRLQTNNANISYAQPEIESSATGIDDLKTFMDYAITKAKMEFMPDRASRGTFQKILLESTDKSKAGIAYQLVEIKDDRFYWDTGILVFRVAT